MRNKNNIIIICSVLIGICAAVATTFFILKYLKNKKSKLDCTSYMFENDFDDEDSEKQSGDNSDL